MEKNRKRRQGLSEAVAPRGGGGEEEENITL
jgi:hypothetical protein